MTVTVLASGFCFIQAGGPSAPAELLYRSGGMYSAAIARHEYWRLVAYGFLHVNFVHLTVNMLCLVLWGGHLEKRVGPAYFLIIYLCAMVFGAVIGNGIHSTPYLTVGASGATSGILGALLCLWILGKLDLRFDFFAINIGLNIAFAFGNSRIDWGVHLGGFAAGLIACALLDLVEKANAWASLQVSRSREGQSHPACLCHCALGLEHSGPGHRRGGFRLGSDDHHRGRMLCRREAG
ncbi:rhomboid family intramembrane serine protease [Bradyrhizobium japonicum]|uniref:rhomboid family intramembrane serine protease n=1 Tax=Bradyrhizobium japonicum TaxID=375 RepID=UPI002013BADE|nr:rhomboid family intramembrane serine protease [Bradyrhizobium japonicum]